VVVPYAVGGGTDVVARLVSAKMTDILNTPVIVENRAGAGGMIGTEYVARAAPDGSTLLLGTSSTQAINPALFKHLSYDPAKAFAPISLLVTVPEIIVVNAKSPYMTFQQLVDTMRAHPGKLTFGSQGVGGISHLLGEMLNAQAGVKSIHVPYKGGGPALQGLLAGNIDVLYDTLPALQGQIQSGQIRPLAVASGTRVAQLQSVPTTAEAGMPKLVAETWNALFAPAGTPADVITVLSNAARSAVKDPGIVSKLQPMSATVVGSTPEELAKFAQAEMAKWAPIVKASGASVS